MPTILREVKYIYTDIETNTNKLWTGQLDTDNNVVTLWGRVSERGGQLSMAQSKTFPNAGASFLERKIKEKERKGYTPLRVVGNTKEAQKGLPATTLEQLALAQIRYSHPDVPSFLRYLCRSNIHNITNNTKLTYDTRTGLFSTSVGQITAEGIQDARNCLTIISDKLCGEAIPHEKLVAAVNNYLRIIPRDFGRVRVNPHNIFPTLRSVQQQSALLDGLEVSLVNQTIPEESEDTEEETPKLFDTSLDLLCDEAKFAEIDAFYTKTKSKDHTAVNRLKLSRVFTIELAQMKALFDTEGKSIGNTHRLFHGTSVGNALSILKSGYLVHPPTTARIAGKMFGDGVYFAPCATKSLNYAYGFWGGYKADKAYMFLNDVAVGKPEIPSGPTQRELPTGYNSRWAKANQSGVINDEVVIFNTSQINPVYLLEFSE